MFNSTVLDVAVGVVFAFLSVSLFTSSAVEAVNSILKTRSKTLRTGIMRLVNDPGFTGLAKAVYDHVAVSPLATASKKPLPSYVDAMHFAAALMDVTGLSSADPTQVPGANAVAALKAKADLVGDPQIKTLLNGIIDRSAGDVGKIQTAVASWFDAGMDQVSGGFKRWSQVMTFVVALAMAVAFNIDAARLATTLWEQPSLADQLKREKPDMPSAGGVPQTREDAARALTAMLQAGLPVGWAPGQFFKASDGKGGWTYLYETKQIYWSAAGWLVTAVAALFGAPFWFDVLQSVVRLLGTGPKAPTRRKDA